MSKHNNNAESASNANPLIIIREIRINLPPDHITPSELHQINMKTDYGRISIIFNHDDNSPEGWKMILKCNKYGNEFSTISIKAHYTWHNDINTHYDLLCPYCPKTFSQRASLNRHIWQNMPIPKK